MLFNLQHFYAVANNKWTLRNTLFVLLVTTGAFLYLAGMLDSIFNNISSHDLSHGYTPTPSLGLLLPGLRSRAHEK